MDKLGQEPAFAYTGTMLHGGVFIQKGISKRFYAACAAMQGLISGCDVNAGGFDTQWTAKAAFNMADELLKQENE